MRQSFAWLETLGQDLRMATRSLKKSPGFLTIVILSLALGIGANSTIFSVIDTLLYRPLPYDHPDQLTTIWETQLGQPGGQPPPIAESLDWKKQNHVFEDIALTSFNEEGILSGTGEAERIVVQDVTPNFFGLLGVKPVLGRISFPSEMQDHEQTVVISYSSWKTHFNKAPDVLGKTLHVTGYADRAPQAFRYSSASPGRNGHHCPPTGTRVSSHEQGHRQEVDSLARGTIWLGESSAIPIVRSGYVRVADCLRQRCEPLTVTNGGATRRMRGANVFGCEPRPPGATVPGRKCAARIAGRHARSASRVLGHPTFPLASGCRFSECRLDNHQHESDIFHARNFNVDDLDVWIGACVSIFALGFERRSSRRCARYCSLF